MKDLDFNGFMNAYSAFLGVMAFTMVVAVIAVTARLLQTEKAVLFKVVAIYAAIAASILGFVTVFAVFFAPR